MGRFRTQFTRRFDEWIAKSPQRFLRAHAPRTLRRSQEPTDRNHRAQLLLEHGFIRSAHTELTALAESGQHVAALSSSALHRQCACLSEGLRQFDAAAGHYRKVRAAEDSFGLALAQGRNEFLAGHLEAALRTFSALPESSYFVAAFTRSCWLSAIHASIQVTTAMGINPSDYAEETAPDFYELRLNLLGAARARRTESPDAALHSVFDSMRTNDAVRDLATQGAYALTPLYAAPLQQRLVKHMQRSTATASQAGDLMLDLQALGHSLKASAHAAANMGNYVSALEFTNSAITASLHLGSAVVDELERLADLDPTMNPDQAIWSMSSGWQNREDIRIDMSDATRRLRDALYSMMHAPDPMSEHLPSIKILFDQTPAQAIAAERQSAVRGFTRQGRWSAALLTAIWCTRLTATPQTWEPMLTDTITKYWEIRTGNRPLDTPMLPPPTKWLQT